MLDKPLLLFNKRLPTSLLIPALPPKGFWSALGPVYHDDTPRALTAHVDTLGAMVRQIKSSGRLRLTQLGGWGWTSVEGEGVTICASNGQTLSGDDFAHHGFQSCLWPDKK